MKISPVLILMISSITCIQTLFAVEPTGIEQEVTENTKVNVSGKLGESTQQLKVSLKQRRLFNADYFLRLEASGLREERNPYELYKTGGECGIGYELDEYTDFIAGYRYYYVDVGDVETNSDMVFRNVAGENQVAGLLLELERSTTDDRKYPTKGLHNKASFISACRGLGGDYNFNMVNLDSAWYFTPWGNFTFALHGHSDWADDFGDTRDMPFFEKFYTGGSSTVRGHRSKSIGPNGIDDEPIGGKFRTYFNAEMRFPVYKALKGAIFFDTGSTWKKIDDFDISDFENGAGFGLRYIIKWWKIYGIARLDYGINLNRQSGESFGRVHATFNMPF